VAVRGLAAAGPDVDVVHLLPVGRRRHLCLLIAPCLWPLLLAFPCNLTRITQLLFPSESFAIVNVITLPKLLLSCQSKTPEIAQSSAHLAGA
jgi:hypothetical protein